MAIPHKLCGVSKLVYNGNTIFWLFHLELARPVRGAVPQVSQHVYSLSIKHRIPIIERQPSHSFIRAGNAENREQ